MALRVFAAAALVAVGVCWAGSESAAQSPAVGQQAFGYQWGYSSAPTDWNRLYHYPYVWYPHNYYADGYMQSANDLYHRYPQEMRIPVYNRQWQNYYPKSRRYHQGHHFHLDVF